MTRTQTKTQAILERDAEHHTGLWHPDIVLTHGDGVKIYDAEGKEYLDCMAGIAVASIGHGNKRLCTGDCRTGRKTHHLLAGAGERYTGQVLRKALFGRSGRAGVDKGLYGKLRQ